MFGCRAANRENLDTRSNYTGIQVCVGTARPGGRLAENVGARAKFRLRARRARCLRRCLAPALELRPARNRGFATALARQTFRHSRTLPSRLRLRAVSLYTVMTTARAP